MRKGGGWLSSTLPLLCTILWFKHSNMHGFQSKWIDSDTLIFVIDFATCQTQSAWRGQNGQNDDSMRPDGPDIPHGRESVGPAGLDGLDQMVVGLHGRTSRPRQTSRTSRIL